MSGLSDNTSYDVYVQADCGSGNVSQWAGPINLITPIINGCSHSLVMYDSWGDGWNGNSVDVTGKWSNGSYLEQQFRVVFFSMNIFFCINSLILAF